MASPAEDVAFVLNAEGVGTTASTPPGSPSTAWVMKIGRLMDSVGAPDQMIGLFDSGGFNPNTKWQLDFVTVQVLVRSAVDGYQAGFAKALEIKDALLGRDPGYIGTPPVGPAPEYRNWWSGVTMLADIAFLKYDDQNRALFSINFRILQERIPTTLSNRAALNDSNA